MNKKTVIHFLSVLILILIIISCQANSAPVSTVTSGKLKVLAAENFLADITQQVAGQRLKVESLMPVGVDPHTYEPTPQDIARISDCQLLFVNGAGLEGWLQNILTNVGGSRKIIEVSTGIQITNGDPHFWLDPNLVIKYIQNISDALTAADPDGKSIYTANGEVYIAQLKQLDSWITTEVSKLPANQRLLVTNHESLGYFASRYGFKIIGSVIPNFSSDAAPSAQQLAQLVTAIKATSARAIFLEIGSNTQLANQISAETGLKVITDLYTETLSEPGGKAPNYLAMMKYNTLSIVSALQ